MNRTGNERPISANPVPRYRPLGNPTHKAWLAGWDKGIVGRTAESNPYTRKPQHDAFDRGWRAGRRSSAADVAELKRRLERNK